MRYLSDLEAEMASGGDGVSIILSDAAIAFGAMSAKGGGFAVMTGIMSAGFAYMVNHISSHPYEVHGNNRR